MLSVIAVTAKDMENRLLEAFPGADVLVHDLTGTADHWEVRVRATQFQGKTRIAQQRAIMDVFAAELATGEVHALTMKTLIKE